MKVKFLEGHVRKRELLRIIKLLKMEHKLLIKNYRKNQLAQAKVKQKASVITINKNVLKKKEN